MVRGIREPRRSFWASPPPRRRAGGRGPKWRPKFWIPLIVIIGICGAGYTAVDLFAEGGHQRVVEATIDPRQQPIVRCGGGARYLCAVNGDTLWVNGSKIRIEEIDTPEVSDPKCASEAALGAKATSRLIELLNQGPFSLVNNGGRDQDHYGRKLRIIESGGKSVGAVLVEERLARWYGGGRKSWCS